MNVNHQELSDSTRVCTKCAEEKPITEFYFKDSLQYYRFHVCINCYNEKSRLVYQLHKENVCNVTACDCCGLETDKLQLDHDHITKEFRGWLCRKCNTGIGKLGDDLTGVMNAVRYLERVSNG